MNKFLLATSLLVSSLGAYSFESCTIDLTSQSGRVIQSFFARSPERSQACLQARQQCRLELRNRQRANRAFVATCELGNAAPSTPVVIVNPAPTHPHRPAPHHPTPTLPPVYDISNYELLMSLERLENSSHDAQTVYDYIQRNYSNRSLSSLSEGLNYFSTLLSLNGGNGTTNQTLTDFTKILNLSSVYGLPSDYVLNLYQVHARAENTNPEGMGNLELILQLSQTRSQTVDSTSQAFLALLTRYGNSQTSVVRNAMSRLFSQNRDFVGLNIETYVQYYITLYRLENTNDDAMGNMDLIISKVRSGYRFQELYQTMIDLLRQYGSGQTPEVRRRFNLIFR
jgi:hypothetical protein